MTSNLSRRSFLGVTAGLAAVWSLPFNAVGRALAAPLVPAEVMTTLVATIRKRSGNGYVPLVAAPGEAFITRLDVLGKEANSKRAATRRSLLYVGHMSDIHIIDGQSPARLDTMVGVDTSLFNGNFRPHELAQVHIFTELVNALNSASKSPITGAPMAFVLNTGDNADQRSHQELRWFIDTLDGAKITANTGKANEYEGVQVWPECEFAYHPDNPADDMWGRQGFPAIPGFVQTAISVPVDSPGLKVPWYVVYGNHDIAYFGGWSTGWITNELAIGDRKASMPGATERIFGSGFGSTSPFEQFFMGTLASKFGIGAGVRNVTPDPNRKLLSIMDYVAEHLESPADPGPVGHGFTPQDLQESKTYYATDVTPYVKLVGLNTCNVTIGAGGSIPQDQFDWMKGQLAAAQAANQLVIIASHHTSFTMDNVAQPIIGPQQNLVQIDEFLETLHQYPNMIAWMNGHTHFNRITAHTAPSGTGGFWEISSSSCVDFAQQGRVTEIVDNQDGTISIFTVVLDHEGPAQVNPNDLSLAGMAAYSRELSANNPYWDVDMRVGSPADRNCELLLPAPFPMTKISDATVAATRAQSQVRLLAKEPS